MRTVFFGSGTFAVPSLEVVASHRSLQLVAVVTAPDRPAGRGHRPSVVPVAAGARALGLTVLQPDRLRATDAVRAIRELEPELGILADYGQLVPGELVVLPRLGMLNLHPSLLPRHRGASPIAGCILAGDTETGVTLMRMDAGLDTGPVVAVRRWLLQGDETAPALEARAALVAADLLAASLDDWIAGALVPQVQDETLTTLTRPLRREDGRLDPTRPARLLERHVRAYQPWPGSWVETVDGRVTVLAASAVEGDSAAAGTLVALGRTFGLATPNGVLAFIEVQPAGGRRMPADAFLRGHGRLVGTTVETGPGSRV